MRIEEVRLQLGNRSTRLSVHPRLTVLAGLDELTRDAVGEALVEALAGDRGDATVRLMDAMGRTVSLGEGTAEHPDGARATRVVPELVPDIATLRRLLVVRAGDLGVNDGSPASPVVRELAQARASRDQLEAELGQAQIERAQIDRLTVERDELVVRVRAAEDYEARIAHAALVERIAALGDELASAHDLAEHEAIDRLLADAQGDLGGCEARRAAADERARVLRSAIALAEPVLAGEPRRRLPDTDATGLLSLVGALRSAEEAAATAAGALAQHRAGPPDATSPLVLRLARLDPDVLWSAWHRLADVERRHAALAHDVGAPDPGDDHAAGHGRHGPVPADGASGRPSTRPSDDLDEARVRRVLAERHAGPLVTRGLLAVTLLLIGALLTTNRELAAGTVALLAVAAVLTYLFVVRPRRRVDRAEAREREAARRTGSGSWEDAQLRHAAPTVDDATRHAWLAVGDARIQAMASWRELAGTTTVEQAAAVEAEVRALAPRCNPALRRTREAELAAAAASAAAKVDSARSGLAAALADCRHDLVEAERDEVAARADIVALLSRLGITAGPDGAREAMTRARLDSLRRDRLRGTVRAADVVAAELEEVRVEAGILWQPHWAKLPPPRREKQAGLLRRRHEELERRLSGIEPGRVGALSSAYQQTVRTVRDLESRVTDPLAGEGPGEVARRLLTRVGRASGLGPDKETLPVVVDDALTPVPMDVRLDLLAMLRRVSERVQVIYLTDDMATLEWARSAAATGTVRVLELIGAGVR
ncbi:MAG: hypothetical protein HYX34_14975 [Actinobacteria bacterium]|nr:hypothetical protein [Actinomycetota bacterium]